MSLKDALGFGGVHIKRPHSALVRAAEDDAVAAGEHVEVARAHGCVIDLRLGQKDGELTLDRLQFCVADKIVGAEARAVDDDRLVELRQRGAVRELPDHDVASGQAEVLEHRAKIRRRLDQHRVETSGKPRGIRIRLQGIERNQVGDAFDLVGKLRIVSIFDTVRLYPMDAIALADESLKVAPGETSSLLELLV